MDYNQVLEYLYSNLPMFHRVGPAALKPGLDNTIQLLARLGNPEQHFRSIHIAGTNGKGSSSHMLAAILQVAGYKTGLYTSPHLKSFTERIKVNGMDIDKDFVVAFVNRNKQHMEEIRPSFFEVTVGMAFEYFATHQVDIAIIETGLGGRLDSTNVVLPLVSLITNISYDHQSILGNSLEQIAGEKAGIIKPHIPVVISETQEAQVRTVFLEKAKAAGSDIFFADQEFIVEAVASHDEMLHVDVFRKNKMVLSDLRLSLTGDYQVKNAAGVLAVLDLLSHMNFPVTETNIRTGLEETVTLTGLKGRWQRLNDSPLTICDTGHNEAGIKLIVEQVKKIPFDKLYWVFGMVNDKHIDPILLLLPKNAQYIFCQAAIPRALDAQILQNKAKEYGLNGVVVEDVNMAYAWAKSHAGPQDLILIGGSTFVVAELHDL